MILAAGRGERMRPLTDSTPKPLLQAGGKSLITWHIERLVSAGIVDIIVNHAWLGAQIERALGDGERYGARIRYSAESTPLETAGGIAQALPFFLDQPFLVINGDIWCDWDPTQAQEVARGLEQSDTLAWLLLVSNPPHHPRGDFFLDESGLIHAGGRMPDDARLTFSGIGVYKPQLFAHLVQGQAVPLAPLLRQAMASKQVCGSHHIGQWADIGTPERLAALDLALA
jgi:MurNAc alpha-1-phosphate uridylyltransferase